MLGSCGLVPPAVWYRYPVVFRDVRNVRGVTLVDDECIKMSGLYKFSVEESSDSDISSSVSESLVSDALVVEVRSIVMPLEILQV